MTFDPTVTARLGVAAVAVVTLGRAAWIASRVLRYFQAGRTTEGQLALERQAELASSLARVGAVALAISGLSSGLAVNALAPSIRGAMCGWGVVHASRLGEPAMLTSLGAALVGLFTLEALSLDRAARGLSVVRVAAVAVLGAFAASVADLGVSAAFLADLDFSVVASCCSTSVDGGGASSGLAHGGPTLTFAGLAAAAAVGIGLSLRVTRALSPLALAAGLGALGAGLVAVPRYVAPHVFETPTHACPYCLLSGRGAFLGEGILAGLLVATAATVGRQVAASLADREPGLFASYARSSGRRAALGLALALALSVAPVLRYRILTHASLFP